MNKINWIKEEMSIMIQTNPSLGKIIELVIKDSIAECVLTKACNHTTD